jgi:hypothetical protein
MPTVEFDSIVHDADTIHSAEDLDELLRKNRLAINSLDIIHRIDLYETLARNGKVSDDLDLMDWLLGVGAVR